MLRRESRLAPELEKSEVNKDDRFRLQDAIGTLPALMLVLRRSDRTHVVTIAIGRSLLSFSERVERWSKIASQSPDSSLPRKKSRTPDLQRATGTRRGNYCSRSAIRARDYQLVAGCGQPPTMHEVQPFISPCRPKCSSHRVWLPGFLNSAYSALACRYIGRSGSASLQMPRNSS